MNDIYDHAPECDVAIWLERAIETDAPRWLGVPDDVACQCQKLRACEQRVAQESYEQIYDKGYDNGYAAGLDAARDAVDAAYDDERYAHRDNWGVSVVYKDLMLAAIDALPGES